MGGVCRDQLIPHGGIMKFKYLLPIALLASPAMADNYRSFSELSILNIKPSKI